MYRFPSMLILFGTALGVHVFLALVWVTSAAAGVGEDAGKLHSDTITVAGTEREFSYFVPGSSGDEPLPIVIYLHGHGDNMRHILGKGRVRSASSVWMDVAQDKRFVVLYPLGAKGSGRRAKTGWNDCRSGARGNPQLDDVEFVRHLINFATEKLSGDHKRVYVTGMSNGGHMAMRVGLELSAEVAAIATVATLMPATNTLCSRPTQPVPILMMHGNADPIAPFEGGRMAGGRGLVLSARETMDTWINWNDLDNVAEEVFELPDENGRDSSIITKHVRERSADGIAVIAYEIQGAGHTEPSRIAKLSRLQKRVQGNQNNDIEMAETIWEFFANRSR